LHAAAADESTLVAAVVTPGQAHDAPVFDGLMAGVPEACPVDCVVADKSYDSDAIREGLTGRDVAAAIPGRSNRSVPVEYDADLYRERNKVERLIGKLKQFRRVATRYEKLDITFLAMLHLAAAFVMIR
jgi:transposase